MSESSATRQSPDAAALDVLKRSGANLEVPNKLVFALRFPSEEEALTAAQRLDELAFATVVERDDARNDYVILATKNMYPVESDLAGLRAKLEVVAKESNGIYEGWRGVKSP